MMPTAAEVYLQSPFAPVGVLSGFPLTWFFISAPDMVSVSVDVVTGDVDVVTGDGR